uniref:Chemosensory protein n=1 Tax=Blattella germanica TaxID=6973 RepID=A0A0X8DC77_BLAGE|nr:chemosensory protein [Blattella germanica]
MNTSMKKQYQGWLVLAGLVVMVLGAVLGWYGFPALIRSQIIENLVLNEGAERREIWEKTPYPMDFKIYLFNVTNPFEVAQGDTPVLKEVGPYCYNEYKEKVNIIDHEEDDTVSFNVKDTWFFNQEESGVLTGDEIITIPHVVILGMILEAEREQPLALQFINASISHIFGNITTPFVTAKAKDLLFEGVPINCTHDSFSAKTICTELKKRIHHFHRVNEHIFKFSILGTKNGTERERLRVKRGNDDIKEVGKVVEFEDQDTLDVWSGDKCNELKGTDATIFPPFLTKKDKIEGFLTDLCRSAGAEYQYATTYNGIRSYKYTADFGDITNDENLKCFCTTPSTCLKRGVHDITRCTGIPLVVSLPHFFLADEEYQDGVIGLNPVQEKHQILLQFEPMTATPLEAYKRLQFNIFMHKSNQVDIVKNVTPSLLPILWVQENMELHQEYIDKILDMFLIISIMGAMKWIMIVIGGVITATGLFFLMRKKNDNHTVITGSPPIALKSTGKPKPEHVIDRTNGL